MIRSVVAIGIVAGAAFSASAAPALDIARVIAALPNFQIALCSGILGLVGMAVIRRDHTN